MRRSLLSPTIKIIETLLSSADRSYDDRRSYEKKLEKATGPEIYKYVLLTNVSALEGYVAQARLQAQQSFNLSRFVSLAGFLIVALAIGMSVYLTMAGNQNLNAAYLTGVAGVLTEFISGVFFFLYSRTLTQINLFHDKLVDMQKTALAYISHAAGTDAHAPAQPLTEALPAPSAETKA
ncbi:MAG: hypothetical protein JSW27_02325 [Phycisphaerales bacterium]|nr:MAG: hypothetical protein JSW27_02325 [Phycisphaerales bacterium]